MARRRRHAALLAAGLLLLMAAAPAGAEALKVFVSIVPQRYFVERIGAELVEVQVLVAPGHAPATFEPSPRQMAALGQADVYFRIGTPFEEGFIDDLTDLFPEVEIVDTRTGIDLRYFSDDEAHEGHGHEPARDGHAEAADPHIWLDPGAVKIQAATICTALERLAPAHAPRFAARLDSFQADLDRVDARLRTALAPLHGSPLYVFHPAFGYFADAYGLEQVAVELEGKEPSPRQLARLIDRARADSVRVLFVQPQYSTRAAATIAAALDGAVVHMDPLAPDYLANLERMATAIRNALEDD